ERLDHRRYISYEQAKGVVVNALGFVAQVVTAQIDGDTLELVGQRLHLRSPGVPKVREPVQHHHQRAFAEARIMILISVGICEAMGDARLEVAAFGDIRRKQSSRSCHNECVHKANYRRTCSVASCNRELNKTKVDFYILEYKIEVKFDIIYERSARQ